MRYRTFTLLFCSLLVFGSSTASSLSDSVIRNQLNAAQDASFWIKGRGLVGANSDLYPNYNFQVFGKTWLDHFVHHDFGSEFVKRSVLIDGNTMGGYVPLHINGNDDGIGVELEDGLFKFIRTRDLYENENYNGDPSTFVFRYPYGAIPYMQRNGHDYTILALQSPPNALNAYETTLALINGDNSEEYVDLYNLSYPSSKKFGFRMQKRGTGSYKPFLFEYSDGNTTYPVVKISPDSSAYFYGKVGIGTTDTKGYDLAVAGSIIAGKVKVKQPGSWPDYVFHKTYRLPSLRSVENYIKTHKHLDGIPAETEVQKEGVDLSALNAKLLQKVEEITLYLIQQDKQIASLKQEITKLKSTKRK